MKAVKKELCTFLALVLLLTSFQWNTGPGIGQAAGNEVDAPAIVVDFNDELNLGSQGTKAESGLFLLGNGVEMILAGRFMAGYTQGYVTDAYMIVQLPYLYYEGDKLMMSYTKPSGVPDDKLMGLEAKATDDNWIDVRSSDELSVIADLNTTLAKDLSDNSTYDSKTGYHRGAIVMRTPSGYEVDQQMRSINFSFRFFGNVPENASAQVKIGAAYGTYHDSRGNTSAEGFLIPPGESVPSEAQADYLRIINVVNSNLVWEPDIELVKTSVLWDKYNYMVYKVRLENKSEDSSSLIDHFALNFAVQSSVKDPAKGGVLEQDMMRWKVDAGGNITENTDISDEGHRNQFIGKPNEGGVLIYDVTDIPEEVREKWDLNKFEGEGLPDPIAYAYPNPGVLGVDIHEPLYAPRGAGGDKKAKKEYYVAVPYPNNFRGSRVNATSFRPTIYFGGRDLSWSKTTGDYKREFMQKEYAFGHNKYVLTDDETPKKAGKKDVSIGSEQSYYLDGFSNTGNVPVFNAKATDTLPERFDLTQIAITLDKNEDFKNPALADWFRTDAGKKDDFLYFEFLDAAGEAVEVSARTLGISAGEETDGSGNKTWTYDAKEAVENYLKANAGYRFGRKLHFYFKERIEGATVLPVDELKRAPEFNGRIAVSGYVDHLLTYVNHLDTSFEHRYWRVATSEEQAGYEAEPQKLSQTEASMTAKRAKPTAEGYGVFHDGDSDTVSGDNKAQDVPLNEDAAGVRFALGNDSPSHMKPGYLKISPLMKPSADGKSLDGLEASSLCFSSAFCDIMSIGFVVFTDDKGKQVTLSGGALGENSRGEIVIPKSAWSKDGFSELVTVEVKAALFAGDIPVSADAYVEVNGIPNQAGEYSVSASWETRYELPDVSEDKTTATARLNVSEIEPHVTAAAHYKLTSGKRTTVPNKQDAWYEFVVENRSKSAAGHVNVDIDLESVGNKEQVAGAAKALKGFRMDKLVLGANYAKSGSISGIKFYDYDQNPKTEEPDFQLSLEDIEHHYQKADGSVEIPGSALPAGLERVKYVRIEYARFTHSVIADEDSEKDSALRLFVYGNTDWYNELTATCSFEPTDRIYTSEDIVEDGAILYVPEPALSLHSHIYYDNIAETSQAASGNTDGNEMITGVPYDRDFYFRTEAKNESLSVLDDVEFTIEAPTSAPDAEGRITGFHVDKVKIYKDILDQFGAFKTMLLTDVDTGRAAVELTYDKAAGALRAQDGTGFAFGEDKTLTLDKETLAALGIEKLKRIKLSGTQVALAASVEGEKQRYVELFGYDDEGFGQKEILKAGSVNYLDGLRGTPAYQIKASDTAAAYVSKMYFDTTITAGYNDGNSSVKFEKTSLPLEHVRTRYKTANWGYFHENSELEIGYKGLGSYMVDFRQYLNVGSSLPYESSRQEHQSMPYVKAESLNTAANVNVEVHLPGGSFEAYYLKVDPRAKDYIRFITVKRKDGTTYKLEGSELVFEANESNAQGNFCRINLLKPDETTVFSRDEEAYYRSPQSYTGEDPENPVTGIVVNLDINQEQNHETADGSKLANRPDYGTWYNEADESSKYMFEVSGRFYKLGASKASANTTLTVGSERSKKRVESGSASKKKTNWSYRNYYSYYYDYYGSRREAEYTSAHLMSEAAVAAVRNNEKILKGATSAPTLDYNDGADFAQDNRFMVSFFRRNRNDIYRSNDENHYNQYEATGNLNDWLYQDQEDWSGKLGFTDEVILRDSLPTIRPDDVYGRYGFLTTALEMKPAIADYVDSVELKLATIDKQNNKTNQKTVTVSRNELKEEGGALLLRFVYADEESGSTTASDGEYLLEENQFVTGYDLHLKDIMGNGEYNKEVGRKGSADFNGDNTDTDLIVHGKPYTVKRKDPDKDGTNALEPFMKVNYDKSTEYKSYLFTDYANRDKTSDTARLMGFLIDFHGGFQLLQQEDRAITEYKEDNQTPTIARFGVKIYNQSKDGDATGKDAVARISKAQSTNTMDSHFRLQKLYIPKAFVDGDWFRAARLSLRVNGKEVKVTLDPAALTTQGADKLGVECYVVDVEQLIRADADNLLSTPEGNRTLTNNVAYVAAHTSSFTLDFEAVKPNRQDGSSVLQNKEYLTADKQDGYAYWYDGVYVDRTKEEFLKDEWTLNSAPSFGRNPNKFTPYDSHASSEDQRVHNRVQLKFTSVDPNADVYTSNNILSGSKEYDYFNLTNRVATMVTRTTRTRALDGGKNGFAYDNDDNQKPRLEVDKDHLMPYDYIEYETFVQTKDDSLLPLERPFMNFQVVKGQKLVKWELVSNDTGIPDEEITAVMKENADGAAEVSVKPGVDYSMKPDGGKGSETYYRKLTVTVGDKGRQLPNGKLVKIRVTTQLTDELTDADGNPAFEGATLQADSWITADPKHNYPQYCIEGHTDTTHTGSYQNLTDEGGTQKYYRNYIRNSATNIQTYEARTTSEVTFKNNTSIRIAYIFDDKGYEYDEQAARLEVTNIKNDTRHYANEMTVTVSFLDKDGYRGFALTKEPVISYPALLAAKADRQAVKIEYLLEGETEWKELSADSIAAFSPQRSGEGASVKECFLRAAEKVRWTYYDIEPYGTDGKELDFDQVNLIGVGRYEDIRTEAQSSAMAEKYLAVNTGTIVHKHVNREEKTVEDETDNARKLTLDKEIKLSESAAYDKYVFRENPQVQFYTQSFDREEQAAAAADMNAAQKKGYRPGDTIWQKVTLYNQHLVDASGSQNQDQGAVVNPIIYDKLPEYLSSEDLDTSHFHVRWKDRQGKEKNEGLTLRAVKKQELVSDDFGGDMVYAKSTVVDGDSGRKAFSDLKPSAANSTDIRFSVYELRFASVDGSPVRVEVGDTLEIWYSLKVRQDNLPMVYVDEGTGDNDTHPAYFPRNGEYYHHSDGYASGQSWPLVTATNYGARPVLNSGRMMDMDYLLHDIGLSADKNEQVDRWEFLNGSATLIPGTGTDNGGHNENMYGNNGVLIDQDANVDNYRQLVYYQGSADDKNSDALPGSQTMSGGAGNVRDWYTHVLSKRTSLAQNWDSRADEDKMPILWSETRLHLQKAWLATSSQMKAGGDHRKYDISNPNYNWKTNTSYGEDYVNGTIRRITDDNSTVALEYNENFTTTLQALNYGDWDLDGVEFTYTMPRGIRPQLDEDGNPKLSEIKAKVLSGLSGTNDQFAAISGDLVEVEVLQKPGSESKRYQAAKRVQDPLWNQAVDADDSYYENGADTIDTMPWVLKITVRQPLKKWFNRGSAAGYKITVDIPCNVYRTNENEYWYDRVITRPYVDGDSQNYSYYQILDIDHWEGYTKRQPHNQPYGMDFFWFDDSYSVGHTYFSGSPNTPYVDGYNIQNNEVTAGTGDAMGTCTNNGYDGYANASRSDLYAQTGTKAVMRKPFVRLWTTAGDDLTGKTREQYYTDTEGQTSRINIHVENKYWWDALGANGESNNSYTCEKYLHNYNKDGGSAGTLILPVVTNILPYGIVPVDSDGRPFGKDNEKNKGREPDWTLYNGAGTGALADEQEKYTASVSYQLVDAKDAQEGRYVITFTPKAGAHAGNVADEARITSGSASIFSFQAWTYDFPKVGTKGEDNDDLYRNYEDNRTYVSSKIDGFQYIVDEDIAGNPYPVGAPAQFRFLRTYNNGSSYFIRDTRMDAVIATHRWSYYSSNYSVTQGAIPDDRLSHSLESDTGLFGRMKRYKETDSFNVEDYTEDKAGNSLRAPRLLSDEQKDFNGSGGLAHKDYKESDALADIGVSNTMKLRTRAPRLTVENYVSDSYDKQGRKEGQESDIPSFQYSDSVWYSAKVSNLPSDAQNFYEQGAIHHGKLVAAFHLPECVSYYGTADWNVQNNDKDAYNNPDDFYVEFYDKEKSKTVLLSQKELREQGWGVEVIADSSKDWEEERTGHASQVVTVELTTPKGEGFTDYLSYIKGEKPAGYLASGSYVNLKIRTRVDNAGGDGLLTQDDVWSGYKSSVYATLHDGDGKFALNDNGTFVRGEQEEAEAVPDISYHGFDFSDQPAKSFFGGGTVASDEKEEDGKLTDDKDLDGVYDAFYVTGKSATINVKKPKASIRLDTSKQRYRANDPAAQREIMEDPHVRSAYKMSIRMDQAVNERTPLNSFIVNYNVPYFGTSTGTARPADPASDTPMQPYLHTVRTGAWELPEDLALSEEERRLYGEHLKVKLFILVKDDPWAETANYYPGPDDSADWRQLGRAEGYGLSENAELTIDEELESKIFQMRLVIQMEAFSHDGVNYNEKQAPIYYPVPKGFRMDIDANGDESDGKQEMDEVDPERKNKEAPVQNVRDNCAFVNLNIEQDSNYDDGSTKHNNHMATVFTGYDDTRYGDVSGRARAGYYVDPEVPTVNVGITTYYFGGGAAKGYAWNDDVIVDSNSSNMLKYKVFYENIDLHNEYSDQASDPNLTVVLPYMERLREDDFEFIDYQETSEEESCPEDYYIGEHYKANVNLDKKTPLWTWHVEDSEGNLVSNTRLNIAKNYPTFTVKEAYISSKTKRKILNFKYDGKLGVGQRIVLEFMVPIESTDAGAVPTDMLECRAFGYKRGSFEPYLDNEGSGYGSIGYELDRNDLNNNGNINEFSASRTANGIAFKTTEGVVQNKTAASELDPGRSKMAVRVNEGGNYNFKASMVNKSGSTRYNKLLCYDVLPYENDMEIMNGTGPNKDIPIPRNSKWHGWLIPESIQITEYWAAQSSKGEATQTILEPEAYEVWVGPIVKEDGKYVDKGVEHLPDRAMMADLSTYNRLTDDDDEKRKYFVKLDDLLKETEGAERERLVKAIRALWVEMNDDEKEIEPACRIELSYDMHEPINVDKHLGTPEIAEGDASVDNTQAYNDLVAETSGFNTFVSKSGQEKVNVLENIKAGVYVDAPSGRGYLGSYVWDDMDYSGRPDAGEGDYGTVSKTDRIHLRNKTTDLDFDGEADDPGINGVKVELLTKNGNPCNKEGEPVIKDPDGSDKYVIVDEDSGKPVIDENYGTMYYTTDGPASFVTESDYYDNQGYFMLSNLKPGDYNLRYTFPENYNEYSVTTLKLGSEDIPVAVFRDGKKVYDGGNIKTPDYALPSDRLVVQTAKPIKVAAVEEDKDLHKAYDQRMTSYNVGVGRPYTYGGYTWLDETVEDGTIVSDGYMDKNGVEEERLSGIEVAIYNIKDRSAPCTDGDGNPAVYTLKDTDDGYFEFRLKPGEKYIAVARDALGKDKDGNDRLLKPTPWTFESDPLSAGDDNDLSKLNGIYETKAFASAVPFDENGKPLYEEGSTQTFARNKNIGLGFVNGGRGYLGKFVWKDEDYDGIMDEDEEGVPDVKITLERYYYDGGSWHRAGDDIVKTTNNAGAYIFDNVMSYYRDGGKTYLAGYKLKLDEKENAEIFKKYGITHYQAGKGTLDSDLKYADLSLNDDYIIIAEEVTEFTNEENKFTYNGKEYDVGDAQIILDYDAGLSAYQYADVDGIIWADEGAAEGHTYNGILDKDESGIPDIKVYLEQYVKIAGSYVKITDAHGASTVAGASMSGNLETTTDEDGKYHFEGVPGFVMMDGERKLCYYRIRTEKKEGMGVTRYQQSAGKNGTNSDWITNEYPKTGSEDYLTAPGDGDYFPVAKRAGKLENAPYTLSDGSDKFDLIRKQGDVKGYDGGLVVYPNGSLTGKVWEDKDYDGIRDDDEAGMDGVEILLKRYYYDGSEWLEDSSFSALSSVSADGGVYRFEDLDTEVKVDGHIYLAGYQVSMKELPVNYGVTRYRQGGGRSKDSDLVDGGAPLAMTRENEYIPVAKKAVKNATGQAYNSSAVKVTDADGKEVWYDMLTAGEKSGYDAGLVEYPTGKLTGVVWDDADYDGIRDAGEKGIADEAVLLERWYYKEGSWVRDDAFTRDPAITDDKGVYLFEELETRVVADGVSCLAGYRVKLEALKENYGCTYYRQGGDRGKDSDLIAGGTPLDMQRSNEYIPVAKTASVNATGKSYSTTAVKFTDADGKEVWYDMLEQRRADGYDAGLVEYPDGLIQGRIWEDENYNGIQDAGEEGFPGVEVLLERYYYKDDEWLPDEDFEMLSSITGSQGGTKGRYQFTGMATQVEKEGVIYLAGYTLRLKEAPENKAITKRLRGKDKMKDSDLMYGTLSLTRPGEYIVTAAEPDKNKPANHTVVSVKNLQSRSVSYDMLKEKTVAGYDGGFSDYTDGRIEGTIWDDADYDGILSEEEEGLAGVKLHLERYIKDGDSWIYDEAYVTDEAVTEADGSYEFDGLKTYFATGENMQEKHLYAYKIKLDQESLPEDYAVTRYRQAKGERADDVRDSDLIAGSNALTEEDEYVLVVTADEGSQNPDYIVDGYDVVQGITASRYDGGLVRYQKGSIAGRVWKDDDYNGIQDENEKGMHKVEVVLERYYFDGQEWKQDGEYVNKAFTDKNGVYRFKDLPTTVTRKEEAKEPDKKPDEGTDIPDTPDTPNIPVAKAARGEEKEPPVTPGEGENPGIGDNPENPDVPEQSTKIKKHYLAGYVLRIADVSSAYAVTAYRQGGDREKDSDLNPGTLTLTKEGSLIVVAAGAKKGAGGEYNDTAVSAAPDKKEITFDAVQAEDKEHYDGGLTPFEKGTIEGTAWLDRDENGKLDEKKEGIAGLSLTLTQYERVDGSWQPVESFERTVKTDKNGAYRFTGLPLFQEIKDEEGAGGYHLLGYRLSLQHMPEGRELTAYRRNGGTDDSLLKELDGEYIFTDKSKESDGCFVLAARKSKATSAYYAAEQYDIVKPRDAVVLNAGFTQGAQDISLIKRLVGGDPQTGDHFMSGLLILLLLLSGAIEVRILYRKRKERVR